MVKGVPGFESDTAQRRLAFLLWVRDRDAGLTFEARDVRPVNES